MPIGVWVEIGLDKTRPRARGNNVILSAHSLRIHIFDTRVGSPDWTQFGSVLPPVPGEPK